MKNYNHEKIFMKTSNNNDDIKKVCSKQTKQNKVRSPQQQPQQKNRGIHCIIELARKSKNNNNNTTTVELN